MADPITEEQLREWEKLCDRATQAPWAWESVAEKSNEFIVGLAWNPKY